MAGSAKIGALHVALGIDTAQFSAGLNKAQGSLGSFGKHAGVAFAAVAAAGVAAAGALALAVKNAADHADNLSKTAQKIGVTTEALSRLEWAAKLSDVSLEQLSGGLTRLSKNMMDVATGSTGPAAIAFEALGIRVTDAAGQLRASDQVFADVAEKFARMEDGATKTAIAVALFGRAGAEMIPLLNAGKQGLADMAAESDRLGQTISTETGKAAEEFNDSLTRLGAVMSGAANQALESLAPAMKTVADTVSGEAFQGGIKNAINLIGWLAQVTATAAQFAVELGNVLPKAVNVGEDNLLAQMDADFKSMEPEQFKKKYGLGDEFASPPGTIPDLPPLKPFTIDLENFSTAASQAKEAIDPLAARMSELSGVLGGTHDPFEQMKLDLTDLATLWENGRISAEQYQQAVNATTMNTAAATLGMVGQLTGAFAQLFKDNKAFAIANAVINTAEGVTKALAQGGIFGFIGAAAVAASGAAQIATILASNPGSATTPTVGSAAAPSVEAPAAPAAMSGTAVNVVLKGGGRYSRDEVESILLGINDALGDGFQLNVQGA